VSEYLSDCILHRQLAESGEKPRLGELPPPILVRGGRRAPPLSFDEKKRGMENRIKKEGMKGNQEIEREEEER